MTKSDSIKELAGALCAFQASVEAITKDSTNPFFKSKYASLGAIIEETRELLAKNGLSYAQFPTAIHTYGMLGTNGAALEPGLCTVLMHTSGEWIQDEFPVSPIDNKPQSLGSAITYARRYALQSILGLQVEDDDGNAASQPKVAVKAPVPVPAKPVKLIDQVNGRKAKIKALVDAKVLNPIEGTDAEKKSAYGSYVLAETGMVLEPENFEEIITRLEALK